MKPKLTPNKPFLLILYGYPGAGKTLFARQFANELENTIHMHADKLQHDLAEQLPVETSSNSSLSGTIFKYLVNEYLGNGLSVILDASLTKKNERKLFKKIAADNKASTIIVWIQIDADSAFSRVKKRDRRKAEDKYSQEYVSSEFKSVISSAQNPDNEDFVVISGKHTFQSQRSSVLKKLFETGILTRDQATQNIVKPGLVNLVPKNFSERGLLSRRNISIK